MVHILNHYIFMKMETTINAEKSGTIKSINVASGDNVETKDLLVEIS